jgi:catechol 2,3-dioxygenase-like lactoylglutathione lyase family enzyme
VNVRYIVNDVDAAIPFYTGVLGFKLEMHPAPGFASLSLGNLQLLLSHSEKRSAARATLSNPGESDTLPIPCSSCLFSRS